MLATISRVAIILSVLATTGIKAFAATDARSNSSETMVWGFLGLCALIVVAQVAPLLRNLKKHSDVAVEQTKAVEHQHSR